MNLSKSKSLSGFAFFGGALVIVPAAISVWLVGASIVQWLLASAIWAMVVTSALGAWTSRGKDARQERLGWSLIAALFWTWLGVPVVAAILVATELPANFLETG